VAATSGAQSTEGTFVASSASLADVVVFPGHAAQLTASFVRAQSAITDAGATGASEIRDLTFGGVAIPVTGAPNQRVELIGVATLVINETQTTTSGDNAAITVNAIRLKLATGEEVILSSASNRVTQ
jgi:hypothetical protein